MTVPETAPEISRRDFLGKLTESATHPRRPKFVQKGTPAAVPSLALHAANRLMFGARAGDAARIEQMGYEAFLEEQLAPELIDDADCDARLAAIGMEVFSETRQQLYDRRNNSDWEVVIKPIETTRHACWTRMLYSKRQLLERMLEFWHDHFNIYGWDFVIRSMWSDWHKVLRQHALGNFRQMLEAIATHPCMLLYLDNYISTAGGPNENYSRELMELHTLGVMNYQTPGGYIDQDVYETSRCFTGWTLEQSSGSATRGEFKYNHDQHDRFIKFVFGTMLQGDRPPLADGRSVLDMLANHIGTARHIATKLARKFIGDNPPADVIESTAQVFYAARQAPDQIEQTLRHLLSSDAFKNARMTKFKRPIDWVTSSMRALDIPYTMDDTFVWLYDPMGQSMFSWRSPDGAPEDGNFWISSNSMLRRWNWAFSTASGWYEDDGLIFDGLAMTPAELVTPRQITQYWTDRLLGRTPSSDTFNALLDFVADGRGLDLPLPTEQREEKIQFVAAACLMTPEFMYR